MRKIMFYVTIPRPKPNTNTCIEETTNIEYMVYNTYEYTQIIDCYKSSFLSHNEDWEERNIIPTNDGHIKIVITNKVPVIISSAKFDDFKKSWEKNTALRPKFLPISDEDYCTLVQFAKNNGVFKDEEIIINDINRVRTLVKN